MSVRPEDVVTDGLSEIIVESRFDELASVCQYQLFPMLVGLHRAEVSLGDNPLQERRLNRMADKALKMMIGVTKAWFKEHNAWYSKGDKANRPYRWNPAIESTKKSISRMERAVASESFREKMTAISLGLNAWHVNGKMSDHLLTDKQLDYLSNMDITESMEIVESHSQEVEFVCHNTDFPNSSSLESLLSLRAAINAEVPGALAYMCDNGDDRHVQISLAAIFNTEDTKRRIITLAKQHGVEIDLIQDVNIAKERSILDGTYEGLMESKHQDPAWHEQLQHDFNGLLRQAAENSVDPDRYNKYLDSEEYNEKMEELCAVISEAIFFWFVDNVPGLRSIMWLHGTHLGRAHDWVEVQDASGTWAIDGSRSQFDERAHRLLVQSAQEYRKHCTGKIFVKEDGSEYTIIEERTGRRPPRIAYHGTSTNALSQIMQYGLNHPYLAKSIELAKYYAESACYHGHGGPYLSEFMSVKKPDTQPVILQIDLTKLSRGLRYDPASMDEIIPIGCNEETRDEAWDTAAREHPEWMSGEYINVPPNAWWVSWHGANSVRFEGVIPPNRIRPLQEDITESYEDNDHRSPKIYEAISTQMLTSVEKDTFGWVNPETKQVYALTNQSKRHEDWHHTDIGDTIFQIDPNAPDGAGFSAMMDSGFVAYNIERDMVVSIYARNLNDAAGAIRMLLKFAHSCVIDYGRPPVMDHLWLRSRHEVLQFIQSGVAP